MSAPTPDTVVGEAHRYSAVPIIVWKRLAAFPRLGVATETR
jgi:hypothetical protein